MLFASEDAPISELVHFPAFVPRGDRVIPLDRPVSRTQPPTVRATAVVFEDPASRGIRNDLDRLAPSDASYEILLHTKPGEPEVEGWSTGSYRSTDGMVRHSLGSTIEHYGLGGNAAYWRKI